MPGHAVGALFNYTSLIIPLHYEGERDKTNPKSAHRKNR
jgi:hypothetical protein